MTDRELMQQALEALNRSDYLGWQLNIPIIKALRERLAKEDKNGFNPDWDTVKAFDDRHNEATAEIERLTKLCYDYLGELTALRAVGQMRESRQWVGLTEEEISAVDWKNDETLHDFARAIEAKLKEKNT